MLQPTGLYLAWGLYCWGQWDCADGNASSCATSSYTPVGMCPFY